MTAQSDNKDEYTKNLYVLAMKLLQIAIRRKRLVSLARHKQMLDVVANGQGRGDTGAFDAKQHHQSRGAMRFR